MKSKEIYDNAKVGLLDVISNSLFKQIEKTGKSVIPLKNVGFIKRVMFAKDASNLTPYDTIHPYDILIGEDCLYDRYINEVDLTILFQIAKECEEITE